VHTSFTRFVKPYADIFYHLLVGKEISLRGQTVEAESIATLTLLRNITADAKYVNYQYTDNSYICNEQSTGRFFKIASCANAVKLYSQKHYIYNTFVVMRPDLIFYTLLRIPTSTCLNNKDKWFTNRGEIMFSPFASIEAFISLNASKCIDTHTKGFIYSNIILSNHLRTFGLHHSCVCQTWQHAIARPYNFWKKMNMSVRQLAGKTHKNTTVLINDLYHTEKLLVQGFGAGICSGGRGF